MPSGRSAPVGRRPRNGLSSPQGSCHSEGATSEREQQTATGAQRQVRTGIAWRFCLGTGSAVAADPWQFRMGRIQALGSRHAVPAVNLELAMTDGSGIVLLDAIPHEAFAGRLVLRAEPRVELQDSHFCVFTLRPGACNVLHLPASGRARFQRRRCASHPMTRRMYAPPPIRPPATGKS